MLDEIGFVPFNVSDDRHPLGPHWSCAASFISEAQDAIKEKLRERGCNVVKFKELRDAGWTLKRCGVIHEDEGMDALNQKVIDLEERNAKKREKQVEGGE